jgi:hypothetical protein
VMAITFGAEQAQAAAPDQASASAAAMVTGR